MKQRIKFALADIRYVQTEIEKILNRTTNRTQRINDPADVKQKSNDHSLKLSLSKSSNFNTTPQKKMPHKTSRQTSPRAKQKAEKIKVQTFAGSPQPSKGIFGMSTIREEKEEPRRSMPLFQKEDNKANNQIKQESSHRNIMMMWKQKQKQKMGNSTVTLKEVKEIQKSSPFIKTKESELSPLKKSKNGKLVKSPKTPKTPKTPRIKKAEIQILPSTITVPQKVEMPYHLQDKNTIPLRSQQNFLIHKYTYADLPLPQKETQLKEKYKLLDQRLQRIKKQFVAKPDLDYDEDENMAEFRNKKKQALQTYYRFSPITKLTKINQKLKRDHDRSLSNQVRKRRERSIQQNDDKPKWAH